MFLQVSVSKAAFDEDVFSVVPVNPSESYDLALLVSWGSVLTEYTEKGFNKKVMLFASF